MHKSRLAGLIIDCQTDDLDAAAGFWGKALGVSPESPDKAGASVYNALQVAAGDLYIEVQAVTHESRVHIDIETDDTEAEVARLEALGARRIADIKNWVVLEAPTGQRFCVVPVVRAGFEDNATHWGE
jgi:predicted enzyme related to lactoylglutathione lyase